MSEALKLADQLTKHGGPYHLMSEAAAELRRLVQENAKQQEALRVALCALERMESIRHSQRIPGYPPSNADNKVTSAIAKIKEVLPCTP